MKFTRTPVALGVATFLALSSSPALAVGWDKGEWAINFDSTFSLGTSIRVEDRDLSLIGNSNLPNFDFTGFNPATNPLFSASQIFNEGQGGFSNNGDLGNLNHDSGEAFSTVFKGTHELDIRYKNSGIFIRGFYFYDFEQEDSDRDHLNPITGLANDNCADPRASEFLCSDARLLDAFFYTDFDIGNVPVSFRIGEQVISWGESTFIQHGINTSNPVDVARSQSPGAELREIFIPVGTAFLSAQLTENFSLSAYYQYEWQNSVLPVSGSFLSTNDFVGEGGQAQNVQLGFTANPDINLDFLLNNLNELGGALRAGADPSLISQAYLAYPTTVAIRGNSVNFRNDPSDQGQYGLKATYYAEKLNETEFSFYLINYHNKVPILSGTSSNFTAEGIGADVGFLAANTITDANIQELGAFTEVTLNYNEDIKLYGFSFNTNIGETALAGEIAYRADEPLQIDDVELLFAGFPQQLANAGLRPDLAGISQLDNFLGRTVGPGESLPGFVESDTVQAQFTLTHVFGPALGTDNLTVLGEFGYVDIRDFPDPNLLRLNGPGTNRSGGLPATTAPDGSVTFRQGLLVGLSNGPETNPFPSDDAWGYRLLANAAFNDVYAGINLNVRATFSHDVEGTTPDPLFLFIEDRKSANFSLNFDYLNRWTASVSYNAFWDGVGTTNALSDRDFVSFVINYAI